MTFYTYRPVRMGPGENIFYRTNSISALDRFAAAGMYGRSARARRRFGRRVPSVTDINATLIAFGPIGKADGAVISTSGEDVTIIKSDGGWEPEEGVVIKSKGDGEISETERRIALATNALGVAAAPTAIYTAARAAKRNQGGPWREVTRVASEKASPKSKVARKIRRAVSTLDNPKTRNARVAAALAGAGLVGMQVANSTGDAIAARAMARAERVNGGN